VTDSIVAAWRQLTRGLRRLVRPRDVDRDLADEVSHFLDQATKVHIAGGMTPRDARRAAHLELGNRTTIEEGVRMAFWENTVASVITDVKYAVRMLRRSPVFTIVVVAVISLGTGAVTTIFSAANSILLRPLPGSTQNSELIGIDRVERSGAGGMQASYPYYTHLRDKNTTLRGLAGWSKVDLTVLVGDEATGIYGNLVSGNFFSVLGARPALGRFFAPEEDQAPMAHAVIVVSHAFWQAHMGADSAAIGRAVRVNGIPFTVIGVAAPEFRGLFTPIVTDAWVPLSMQPGVKPSRSLTDAGMSWIWMFGRMRDGVDRDAVHGDLTALTVAYSGSALEPTWASRYTDIRLIALNGLPDDAHKVMVAFIGVLLAAAFLVLLIASVNVAAMLSARAVARRHEMAIRIALGAARARVVRQLMTESLVLFALGAVGGVLIAVAATRALETIPLPSNEPLGLHLAPDSRVLAFALFVSLLTGAVFGLAPALRAARQDINTRLRDDARSGRQRTVVSDVLVVGQLSLSLVLLVSAGLLLRALKSGQSVDPGFDTSNVATAEFKTASWGYDLAKSRAFFIALRARLEGVPGVTAVSLTSSLPLQLGTSNTYLMFDDSPPSSATTTGGTRVQEQVADANYFAVLRIPVTSGREFAPTDDDRARKVVIVNETLAKKHFPTGDAVGHTVGSGNDRLAIVGVVRDAKYASLTESTPEMVYFPTRQTPLTEQTVMVRTSGDPAALTRVIQDAARALDPAIPRPAVQGLAEATSFALLPQRVAALVAGSLGVLGLILATVGLYGIISYSVSRRSREIGVRMALGARAGDVERMVVREGMRLALLGVAAGLVLAAGAARLIGAYLYGVSPLDAPTFVGMSLLFVLVALLASWLPARRAAAASPLVALRAG